MLAGLISDAIVMMTILSVIPMGAIAFASGIIALIQAATQIQEQSVTHLVRLATFGAVAVVAGEWAGGSIVDLFERIVRVLATTRGDL